MPSCRCCCPAQHCVKRCYAYAPCRSAPQSWPWVGPWAAGCHPQFSACVRVWWRTQPSSMWVMRGQRCCWAQHVQPHPVLTCSSSIGFTRIRSCRGRNWKGGTGLELRLSCACTSKRGFCATSVLTVFMSREAFSAVTEACTRRATRDPAAQRCVHPWSEHSDGVHYCPSADGTACMQCSMRLAKLSTHLPAAQGER